MSTLGKGEGPIPPENQAATSFEMEGRLLSNVAHWLRSPLLAIRGYTRMVLEGGAGDVNARQRNCLGAVLENTERLVKLAADLERISELAPLRLERVDLGKLLASSAHAVEPLARERRVRLVTQPFLQPTVVLAGDRSKLERAIECLLASALALAPEEEQVRLEYSYAASVRETTVTISSRGLRLASEGGEALFHPMGTASRGEGTRFELSHASDVIRLHGGEVAFAEEEAGRGAFVVKLPVIEPSIGEDSES